MTASLFVHRSNRAEQLIEMLAEVVRPPLPPLERECIAVQGRGMERWLAMELSRRLGMWANPDFPFPRRLIERILDAAVPAEQRGTQELHPFAPEVLPWSIAAALPPLLAKAELAQLRLYLDGDQHSTRRLQLSERIAAVFDQYAVFRPELVAGWQRGQGGDWQAILWRAVAGAGGAAHIAARAQRFFDAAQRGALALDSLPSRISLFGLSTLPPLFVRILAALAGFRPVHLFLLSPSDAYWAHLRSPREQARARARGAAVLDLKEDDNPLLASLGRAGRELQDVIENEWSEYEDHSDYLDPGADTLLHLLQSDIFQLRRPGSLPAPAADASIAVHACHNPMREVEVLYDQLLDLFAHTPDLAPHEVLVMSPAIDDYAPFVDAVFGADKERRIPYRIADRAVRATDEAIAAFLTVLQLCRSRMTAAEVVDLLAFDSLRSQFGLQPEDTDLIRAWVRDAGVRWGVDASHRAAVEQPEHQENTWRFGLDRLLLGYAMPGEERRMFSGVLPYDDVEGSAAEVLGKLAELCESLFSVRALLQQPRSPERWRDDLGTALARMIANNNATAFQHQQVREALAELAAQAAAAGFDDEIELATVQARLEALLERRAPGRNFLTGGVTFCAMLPMRSIPFRVICLLGMNDTGFPRNRRRLGFDLIAQQPRPGDRSSRDDDRYLFLEALLSARERLIVTYVGQSIRDNTEIPPSVVVSELLDTIAATAAASPPPPRNAATQLTLFDASPQAPKPARPQAPSAAAPLKHPLQPFSPRYFGGGGESHLFSYSDVFCAGAQALLGVHRPPAPFLAGTLPPRDKAETELSLNQLARFFENPARALLRQRLSLFLGSDQESLAGREPIELDGLERWQIGDRLVRRALAGEAFADLVAPLRAAGMLPPGTLGEHAFDDLREQAELLVGAARGYRRGDPRPDLEIDLTVAGVRLTGTVDLLWPSHRLVCHFSQRQGKHLLAVWIPHLALSAQLGDDITTILLNRSDKGAQVATLRPVPDAERQLAQLLELYRQAQDRPTPLFSCASFTFASLCQRHGDEAKAIGAARVDLFDKDFVWDEYTRVLFENDPDPLGLDSDSPWSFRELSRKVYFPLLAHMQIDDVVADSAKDSERR
ncbi:MAG TPA: exodeoxyribonuclease V subunit gamma [Terriglobales bacterium]|nr:exodeoxyribonuclease V subunit gamma [Terriglobales bacterium]